MAVVTQHKFSSAKADGADTTLVRPSNWNAGHDFVGGATGALLVRRTGESDGADWSTNFVGPYAIGGATEAQRQLRILGSFTGSAQARGISLESTLIPAVGSDAYGLVVGPTLNEAVSGTHTDFASALFEPPTIGAGAAALTNASTVKITGAPTGATNNYSLWVAGGRVRINNHVVIDDGGSPSAVTGPGFGSDTGVFRFVSGSSRFQWNNNVDTLERMRLTDAGILALGTTVTTGAAAGDLVLANNKFVRGVNTGGTAANALLGYGTANEVILGNGSNVMVVGAPASIAGAAGGDLVLANDKSFRITNGAGTGTIRALTSFTIGGVDTVVLSQAQVAAVGSPASVTGAAVGDLVLANAKALRFVNVAGTSTANFGILGDGGDNIVASVPGAGDLFLYSFAGVTRLEVKAENSGAGILYSTESTADHSAPGANQAVLYTKDVGGRTTVFARFNTGGIVALAEQDRTSLASVEVLDREATNFVFAAGTGEQTVYSFSVPANTLGTDRRLRLAAHINRIAAVNGTTTWRCKYGATTLATLTTIVSGNVDMHFVLEFLLTANDGTGSQEGVGTIRGKNGDGTGVAGSSGTAVEDSTTALNIVLTGQHDIGDSSITMRSAMLELI